MEKRDDIDIAIFDPETRTTLRKEGATMISNTNHGQRKASNKEPCNNSIKFYKAKCSNIDTSKTVCSIIEFFNKN